MHICVQWRSQAGAHWGMCIFCNKISSGGSLFIKKLVPGGTNFGGSIFTMTGRAPPVQALLKIIGAECAVINRELGVKTNKSAKRC